MTAETTRSDGMPASFQPGIRLAAGDIMMLAVAGAFAWWAYDHMGVWLTKVTAFVVGNFLLFSNVFRVNRTMELMWTIVFVCLAAARLRMGLLEWSTIFAISGALTIAIILIEMRKPSYHGVGWETINPGLREWWLKEKAAGGLVPQTRPLGAGDGDA
jgi:hypothetical protein